MHDTSSALSAFDIAAILVVASALLGWFNHHFIKLPHVIGLTVMGALTAIGLMIANAFIPAITLGDWVADILRQLNFTETLLQGMLSFLLFAGALHVDLDRLKVAWLPVLLLSTVGVIVSTVLVGLAMWGVGLLLALPVAPIWYFVFGALIAPTDPVSVLGVLREENVPQSLQSAVAGESLFNDGVGIVVFIILLGAAISGTEFSLAEGARLFAIEAGGGILVGLAAGYVGYRALAGMDEYALEVLVTLAIVMGGYALCSYLHVSGPLAMAVAGLLVGNQGVTYAMSDVTRDYVIKFWELVDELLNSVLFLLIGLEMIVLVVGFEEAILALAAIPLTLAARARRSPAGQGRGTGAVVGRSARRHFDRARAFPPARGNPRPHPCRDIRRRPVQRSGPARHSGPADRKAERRSRARRGTGSSRQSARMIAFPAPFR